MMTSGARKLDDGKAPVMRGVFLRFPRAMIEIAKVSAVGTTKYAVPISDMEYKNVADGEGRYTDALGRHLLQEAISGPTSIEYGGALPAEGSTPLLHAAQVAWDALARLEIMLEKQAKTEATPMPSTLVAAKVSIPHDGAGFMEEEVSRDTTERAIPRYEDVAEGPAR